MTHFLYFKQAQFKPKQKRVLGDLPKRKLRARFGSSADWGRAAIIIGGLALVPRSGRTVRRRQRDRICKETHQRKVKKSVKNITTALPNNAEVSGNLVGYQSEVKHDKKKVVSFRC